MVDSQEVLGMSSRQGPSPSDFGPTEVQAYLRGLDYPASTQDLINRAKEQGAPQEIIDVLDRLPRDITFHDPTDVSQAFGELR